MRGSERHGGVSGLQPVKLHCGADYLTRRYRLGSGRSAKNPLASRSRDLRQRLEVGGCQAHELRLFLRSTKLRQPGVAPDVACCGP